MENVFAKAFLINQTKLSVGIQITFKELVACIICSIKIMKKHRKVALDISLW